MNVEFLTAAEFMGHEQGVHQEKYDTARRLIQEGLGFAMIARATRLSESEIEALAAA